MSQRIDQLWAQALDAAVPETYTQLSHSQVLKVKQVFADMIVSEAIAVVQRRFMGDLNREDMEIRRCVEDVKKHFGVEESSAQPEQEAAAFIAVENKKTASRYGYVPKLHPSEWKD